MISWAILTSKEGVFLHGMCITANFICSTNPTAAQQLRAGTPDSLTVLNGLSWTSDPQLAISLQDSVQHGTSQGFCSRENVRVHLALQYS